MGNSNDMPNPDELREMFKVLSETVPGLLESLAKVMYGEKESAEYGKAVANFYKALTDAGMTTEQAFQLTREYMGNMSLGNIFRGVSQSGVERRAKERSGED
ncbi:MAG: hypothetical protein ISF22_01530 [Methanomassiliicoccus sp.]|nr:hypothetical protein [Methanomassiliicoccus sp.]